MLTIKPIEDYKNEALEMNISIPENAFVMAVKDGDTLMGIGVARLFDDYASVDEIAIKDEFKDFSLEYGLGKALLNAIDLKGIKYVVSNSVHIEKQLRALKFKSPDETKIEEDVPDFICEHEFWVNLDGYFTSNC